MFLYQQGSASTIRFTPQATMLCPLSMLAKVWIKRRYRYLVRSARICIDRLSFLIRFVPIPSGMDIQHRLDAVAALTLGARAQNSKDNAGQFHIRILWFSCSFCNLGPGCTARQRHGMAFVTQDIRASVFLGPHLIWTYLDRSPEPSDAYLFCSAGWGDFAQGAYRHAVQISRCLPFCFSM